MKFLKGLKELGGGAAVIEAYLQEHQGEALEESKGFWAKGTGEISGWDLVLKLVEMVEKVNRAIQAAAILKTAEEVISAYVASWHEIDLTHWQLCCAARKAEEMELIVSVADRFYTKYLDEAGRAFYETFRDEGKWPPSGCKSVSEVVAGLFNEPTVKRAIIIVDALRFDLAANLRRKLGEGSLEPYVANVPSETHVGMASLLPQPNVRAATENGKLQLLSNAAGGDLCFRSYRWKLLETAGAASLGKDKKGGLRDEIRYLWDLVDPPKNLPRLLILFDRGMDEIGHDLGNEVILHFEELLSDLERAIRKLRSWGYLEIHVLTDHGFILMQTIGDVLLMEVEKDRFALLSPRYGILKTGETVATAMVPFPLDQRWSVALPPGLRSFSAPGKFFHGGATLQEVVLPHLKFVTKAARSRMRVRVLVPQVEIYTMAVKVELAPEKPIPDTFFTEEPEAIKVNVFLGSPDAPRSNTKIIEIGPNVKDPISVTLILNREPAISVGAEIPVQVIDTDKESYAIGLFVRAARDLG